MLILCNYLISIEIPFSSVSIKTDANMYNDFVRIDPDDRKPETLKTKAWCWYDEDNFYIRYEAQIDSTFYKGEYSPRDVYVKDDYVRLQIITIPEAYYAYYYEFHPVGSLYDGIRKSDINVDYNWNSSYSYTSEYNDSLWVVVAKLPFNDMRFGSKPPYQWKIILSRNVQRSEEYFSSPYANVKEGKEYFSHAHDIILSHHINRSSDWKFRPYYAKGYDLIERESTYDPDHVGMDISFNPSTRTKLKIALNPDFSDVPPDDAQNTYNDKYPPYYSENRFFFTEDIDAFGVDYDMFYTRFIAQPQVAVKFTGNSKTWNYGYLCAKDKKITDDGYIVNRDDFYQLASVIKTLPKFQSVFSSASRINTDYYNHLGIAYWDWEFLKNLYCGTSHILSIRHQEDDPSVKENLVGSMFNTHLKYSSPNWNFSGKYSNLAKDLCVDTGRYYETGYENYDFDLNWNSDTKEKTLKSWGFNCGGSYSDELEKNRPLKYENESASAWFTFLNKYSCNFSGYVGREANEGIEHNVGQWNCGFNFYKWDFLSIGGNLGGGRSVIYELNQTANAENVSIGFYGSVGKNLNWSVSIADYFYGYDRKNLIASDSSIVVLDKCYQIGNAKLHYNFNNRMSLRNGFGISTYDADGYYSLFTFFSNFQYEFKKDWFLYIGYQTGQIQDDKALYSDPLGHFIPYTKSAYLKLSVVM